MNWQNAKVIKNTLATSDIKSLVLKPEFFSPFQAGQHYELCFSGKNIIRKYSVVSDIYAKDELELGVQLIEGGALSPDLWKLKPGDEIEVRGPIGTYFNWDPSNANSIILIGAGAGITPLISIYNSYMKTYPEGKCVFIMSAKDASRIMNFESLKEILITRFTNIEGRIDLQFLKKTTGNLASDKNTVCYISGPDNFIDDMTKHVLELGINKNNLKFERFI